MRRFFPVLVLALAACAQQPWSKEDASDEQRLTDQRACEDQAYREVFKRQERMSTAAPAMISDSQARRFNLYGPGPFADVYGTQLQEESRLTSACLREKGYQQK
ncbi:MAG: hypothetical protein QOD26_2835 [Betaproteobacteria bacterium]|nr:hypothetical protein [Betaproteobacteria bacterium]